MAQTSARMIKDQDQIVGEGGLAVQAGGNVTVTAVGLTLAEARTVAMDVAKATFYELSGAAKETAAARVEEITERVLAKLLKDYPEGLQKAIDPDFQYALFSVQKEFARNGDKDLGDLLVDLLVDRSKQDQRDILQIVLNESINTAPKLTEQHLAALAVIFLLRYTRNNGVGNHDLFGKYLDEHVKPFASKLPRSNAAYQHLDFTGCGSISISSAILESILGSTYQGQFLNGFESAEIESKGISIGRDARFFIPCLNDATKTQVRANSQSGLEELFDTYNIKEEDRGKILELFNVAKFGDDEIREKVIEIRPYMKEVFDCWSSTPMKNFTLTSVGMAIGHANIKRLVGEFASLAIWIN